MWALNRWFQVERNSDVTLEEAEAFLKIDDVDKNESNNMDVDAGDEPADDDMVSTDFPQIVKLLLAQINYP